MCGICGIVDQNRNNYVSKDLLSRMCSHLSHRGPDDGGVFVDRNTACVGLGHRRLSIIDLSVSAHQPMANEDETVHIVFNGEIYNYKELRVELEKKGHKFKSHTDTETIIHLYEEYQEECIKFLRGMFAFAIWDSKKQILLLARDRVGKKPLLYTYVNGKLCFASEFLAIIESGLVSKEINPEAIDDYLSLGYIPAPLTIYKHVFKLQPAHMLIFKENNLSIKRYWNLEYQPKISISEEEASEEILRLLKEAVKIRLYSDVPLGAFLSGGIDSSTIVGLMSQLSANKVKTFSIGFEEKDYSELQYAAKIARRFNTDHHEFMVKPRALEILPLLVERYGEPYADSSCIPTYYVSQQTRRYVTVALNGDGGDESFAGYERYQAMLLAEFYQKLPALLRKAIFSFTNILPDSISPKNKLRRIKRFCKAVNLDNKKRYIRWVGISDENFKKDIYLDAFIKRILGRDVSKNIDSFFNNSDGLNLLDRLLRTDVNTYLPGDLLAKVDIASMANSLEVRSPFLDHKLMEFAAKLPADYKIKGFTKKYILKKVIKNLVPKENIYRRKMGFGVPLGNWLRNDLKGLLCETLISKKSLQRGYFNPESIKSIVQLHIDKKKDYAFQLWALLMLELWHKRFID